MAVGISEEQRRGTSKGDIIRESFSQLCNQEFSSTGSQDPARQQDQLDN